jgi:hypothetical protein
MFFVCHDSHQLLTTQSSISLKGSSNDDTLVLDFSTISSTSSITRASLIASPPLPPIIVHWDGGTEHSSIGDAVAIIGGPLISHMIYAPSNTSFGDGLIYLYTNTINLANNQSSSSSSAHLQQYGQHYDGNDDLFMVVNFTSCEPVIAWIVAFLCHTHWLPSLLVC